MGEGSGSGRKSGSFWTSLPGVLTGLAALIAALAGAGLLTPIHSPEVNVHPTRPPRDPRIEDARSRLQAELRDVDAQITALQREIATARVEEAAPSNDAADGRAQGDLRRSEIGEARAESARRRISAATSRLDNAFARHREAQDKLRELGDS